MPRQDHRSGGKYGGSHTTLIPAAGIFTDLAAKEDEVRKITLGYITSGLTPVQGRRRVKFAEGQGSLLLDVRDNISQQEIRIYTDNIPKTRLHLARAARERGFHISFK